MKHIYVKYFVLFTWHDMHKTKRYNNCHANNSWSIEKWNISEILNDISE